MEKKRKIEERNARQDKSNHAISENRKRVGVAAYGSVCNSDESSGEEDTTSLNSSVDFKKAQYISLRRLFDSMLPNEQTASGSPQD